MITGPYKTEESLTTHTYSLTQQFPTFLRGLLWTVHDNDVAIRHLFFHFHLADRCVAGCRNKSVEIPKYPVSKIYPSGVLRKVHSKHVGTLKKLFVEGAIKPEILVFAGVEDDRGSVSLYDGQHRITAIHELNAENIEKGKKPFYSGLITVIVPSEPRNGCAMAFNFLRKEIMSLPYTLKEKIAHVRQLAAQIGFKAEELACLRLKQLKDIFHALLCDREYPEYVIRLGVLSIEEQGVMEAVFAASEKNKDENTCSANQLISVMRSFLYARSRDRVLATDILRSVAKGEKQLREAVKDLQMIAPLVETELIKKGYDGSALQYLVEKIPNTANAAKVIREYRIRVKGGKMPKEMFYDKIVDRLAEADQIRRVDIRLVDVFVCCDLFIADDTNAELCNQFFYGHEDGGLLWMGTREKFLTILDKHGLSKEAVCFVLKRQKAEKSPKGDYFDIAHLCVMLVYRREGLFLPEKAMVAAAKELSLNMTTIVELPQILKLVCAGSMKTAMIAVSKELYFETVPVLAEQYCNICIGGREGREICDIAKNLLPSANFS